MSPRAKPPRVVPRSASGSSMSLSTDSTYVSNTEAGGVLSTHHAESAITAEDA